LKERSIQGGIACELVQTGSLYHDDVMDEAATRRGVETVNAKWGNLQAILAGDFLLSRASGIAASLGTEVAGLLALTIGRLCEGQIEELRHTYNSARPETSYMASISGKTASLYATAARIGGLVAGFDTALVDALTEYGEAYGIVFQIVDDLLDITSTDHQLGKPAGHDMVEGVYTLPVMRTLQAGGVPAMELLALLGKPLDTAEREKALGIVRQNGGIESAFATAQAWAARAEAACDALPDSAATNALRAAPANLVASVG
jgi:heptaprenyl diphosphate synthase